MVCEMDSTNSNEDGRASVEPAGAASGPLSGNCVSARQSPKVCVPTPTPNLPTHRNSTSPSLPRKIISRNHNNTIFQTSYPTNLAELQLYRVMQNASLLVYYDTLLEMGGDDVQQLCDAGEEEFLEIMSLVGMASKPLHVRRLQKSLQEWVTNPAKFKLPLVPGEDFEVELSSPRVTSNHGFYSVDSGDNCRTIYSPSPGDVCALPPIASPGLTLNKRPYSPLDPSCPPSSSSSPGSSMTQTTPTLVDSQIAKLAAAAERLSKHLPQFEPKAHNTKKKVCKELELVMSMPENDPRRMDEIRRYAAIYGRFDCKRKPEKPLTLHEVSVNEAAAQICRFIPALLTRRDELFPLARQVVKDSGCYYSKTQLSTMYMNKGLGQDKDILDARCSPRISDMEGPLAKKPKIEANSDGDEQRQETSSDETVVMRTSLHSLFHNHSKSHIQNRDISIRRSSLAVDFDDGDSHFSYSNSNSPSQHSHDQDSYPGTNHQNKIDDLNDADDDSRKLSPKVQVIAASGDNIIAVANPALAMSPAIIAPLVDTRERNLEKE
ncbi:NGFI-A-binding protein homolog isoform X2 [Tribolium castaneum]|nr:PREDICTED: NGFI-A-binding protein homolog isoform X2 [Tribolium castaneum]|eukprot:XP_008200713.1 PREDICTED: NGFI-A-binding protein homolog isoform X2 [Tribolium castaneum]